MCGIQAYKVSWIMLAFKGDYLNLKDKVYAMGSTRIWPSLFKKKIKIFTKSYKKKKNQDIWSSLIKANQDRVVGIF